VVYRLSAVVLVNSKFSLCAPAPFQATVVEDMMIANVAAAVVVRISYCFVSFKDFGAQTLFASAYTGYGGGGGGYDDRGGGGRGGYGGGGYGGE
jgi:hypothetical protein